MKSIVQPRMHKVSSTFISMADALDKRSKIALDKLDQLKTAASKWDTVNPANLSDGDILTLQKLKLAMAGMYKVAASIEAHKIGLMRDVKDIELITEARTMNVIDDWILMVKAMEGTGLEDTLDPKLFGLHGKTPCHWHTLLMYTPPDDAKEIDFALAGLLKDEAVM